MAYISNKERGSLIKKINKSYAFRKVIITLEILLLVAFLVMTFFCFAKVNIQHTDESTWKWFIEEDGGIAGLTSLGWIMLIAAIVIVLLGLISLVLIYSMKSPKDVTKEVERLEAAPLSGKKIKKSQSAKDVVQARKNKSKK